MDEVAERTAGLSYKKRLSLPLFRALFLLSFLAVIISSSPIAPGVWGNTFALLSYLVLTVFSIIHMGFKIKTRRYVAITILLITSLYLVNLVRYSFSNIKIGGLTVSYGLSNSIMIFGSIMGYLLALALYLIFLPKILRKQTLFKFISILSATSVIVGLPMMFLGEYSVLGIKFLPYTYLQPFRGMGVNIYAVNSYFSDANDLSRMAFFGIFSSLFLLLRNRKIIYYVLLSVNTVGLLLGNSRGAIVTTLLGVTLFYAMNKGLGEKTIVVFLIFAMIFGNLLLSHLNVHLAGRGVVWQATIRTVLEHPLLGTGLGMTGKKISPFVSSPRWVGLGTQNTYLFVFLTSGILGGASYVYLVLKSIWEFAKTASTAHDHLLLAFACSLTFLQWFEDMPIFGINKVSLITGLVFGFLIHERHQYSRYFAGDERGR